MKALISKVTPQDIFIIAVLGVILTATIGTLINL